VFFKVILVLTHSSAQEKVFVQYLKMYRVRQSSQYSSKCLNYFITIINAKYKK